MISFFRAHKRTITILLVVLCAFWLSPRFDFEFLLFVVLIVSQLFWIRRALDLGECSIPGKPRRIWLAAVAIVVYAFFCVYSHTFRHSAATIVNQKTGNLKLVQRLLGHSNLSTTADVYTHSSTDSDRSAAIALEQAIFGDLFQVVPRLGTWNKNAAAN